MSLLVDLFGYLSVVLHGLTIAAQAVLLGSVLFLAFAVPLAPAAGRDTRRLAIAAGVALLLCEVATIGLQGSVLIATIDLTPAEVAGAGFVIAAAVEMLATLLIIAVLARRGAPPWLPLLLGAMELAAATTTTHAAARLDHRLPLLGVAALHQFGAAIWIGGIPAFLASLIRLPAGAARAALAARFSRMSMLGVAALLSSGMALSVAYVVGPDWQFAAFYGTAYGIMVLAKIALLLALLVLGFGNMRSVARLRADPAGAPTLRLRRFAEVEIGIGFSVFFAAAALTSAPPSVDLMQDRVTWKEIVARDHPVWPRLTSPDRDTLYLPALQAQLDREKQPDDTAFVPGGGEVSPRNAGDIAWSEYNHHWAGLFVLAIGLLALLTRAGLRWARHWPLLFLGLGGFIAVRADPEAWPLGNIGFGASLRDVEVLQHRFFALLTVGFGAFEWRVRALGRAVGGGALIFPLASALGGVALLTHSHAVTNVKEQMLVELAHTPLAVLGIIAGWSRWLELRLPGREGRWAGWLWPICFVLIALVLLDYREA